MPTIWSLVSEATKLKLKKWQVRHYNQELNSPEEPERDRRIKVDLAIDSRVIEELIDKPAHDHRLRGEE